MQELKYMMPLQAEGAALAQEAEEYLRQLEQEGVGALPLHLRLAAVRDQIHKEGSYSQTATELEHGARMAWRNSNRCIGRLYWQSLKVMDKRHLRTPDEIFEACVDHIRSATNDGKIRPAMTVFAPRQPGEPGIRIWNSQLIRYAGYRNSDGSVIGDPANAELTDVLLAMGWRGKGTPFDILPLIIEVPGYPLRYFELPKDAVLEVPLAHPNYPWFAELGLRWHALPAVSNMAFVSGGIHYTAAPFNGWYMGTEIGARNLGDAARYNLLPVVAERLGLDTASDRTLWRDRTLVELNVAVLHSFQQHGVMMMDHHTATRHFMRHVELEAEKNRTVTGDWSWLVPPISGSATPVFHESYSDTVLKPNFFYQPSPWLSYRTPDELIRMRDEAPVPAV